jgi:choline dehydrogenase-like flavoprotein
VKGLKKLRIADAGIFPLITSVNPVVTVLCVTEGAAEMLTIDVGWQLEWYADKKRAEWKASRSTI